MIVPAPIGYFLRLSGSSDRNQLERSIGAAVVLRISIQVWLGVAGLARISLTTTALGTRLGTSVVGSPSTDLLARHESLSPQVLAAALGSTMTSENPSPSVCGSQLLS